MLRFHTRMLRFNTRMLRFNTWMLRFEPWLLRYRGKARPTPAWLIRLGVLGAFAALAVWSLATVAAQRPPAGRPPEEFVPPGARRITVTVVDDKTAEPLAARVAFTDTAGRYYPPLGHPWRIPSGPYGGDLALPNGKNYGYVEGPFEIELPPGEISIEASRGFEYDVYEGKTDVASLNEEALTIRLHRWIDMTQSGWYPGDTHIHFPDPVAAMTEMKAEGLRVTNLLAYKGGVGDGERPGDGTFKNVEHFSGKLSPLSTPEYLLYANEEFRNHFLGHLIFLKLQKLVWPISTGELPENGWGGYALPTHADAAELARKQGALVIWAHFPYPNGECPVDVALGKIDAFDILTTGDPFQLHPTLQRIYRMYGPRVYDMAPIDVYYQYLNCGFRISASSGSDKMSTSVPMGSARVYVNTGRSVDYASWVDGIRQGRTFISTGPIVEISVDGKGPGEELRAGKGSAPQKVKVKAHSRSRMPYKTLEIIHNGKVVASSSPTGAHFEATLEAEVDIERSGWVAARCYGREMLPYGGPPGHWFRMPVFAHTNPVWVTVDGRPTDPGNAPELFLEQIEYNRNYVLHEGRYPSNEARQRALDQIEQAVQVYRGL
jgi:hypothetical protein